MPIPQTNIETGNKVSDLLRKVDSLIKAEELTGAREEILRAREIDPRNMYAHAYLERVELLLDQQRRNREVAKARNQAEEEARAREEQDRLNREREAEARLKAFEEERKKHQEKSSRNSHIEEVSSYNAALFQSWTTGVPSPEQQRSLNSLRTALHISDEEHSELESAVRRECYVLAFRQLWASEDGMPEGPSTITALRRLFRINTEEFDTIEVELLNQLRRPKTGPLILLIDDDQGMLNAVSVALQEAGFDARGFLTSDEAYSFLIHTTPELILCDINLETSTLGGFAFYEKLQELPRLTHVPFVFMSGLTDEVIIRAGKQMGVDDYLTKPFDTEKLLSILRGKIRRYHELRTIASIPSFRPA